VPDKTPPSVAAAFPAGDPAAGDRFLSEFALALVGGGDLGELVEWSVGRIGDIVGADRVTLLLFDGSSEDSPITVRAGWSAPGVAPLPASVAPARFADVGPVLRGLQPIVARDALSHPALAPERERFAAAGTKSLLAAPIQIDGILRGVALAATVREPRDWSAGDVEFLLSAARHLAAGQKQAELIDQLERERERLSVLFDLASEVQRGTTAEDVIRAALAGLRKTLGFHAGFVALLSSEGNAAAAVHAFAEGWDGKGPGPFGSRRRFDGPEPGPKELAARVLESGVPLVVSDVARDPRAEASRPFLLALGVTATAVLPMRAAGRLVGILSAGGPAGETSLEPDDVAMLQSLADFVGVALEQRRVAEALERSAREAHALSEASRALLTRTARRDILLNQILDAVVLHFGQENCSLRLVGRDGSSLSLFARRGEWQESREYAVLTIDGPGLVAAAARTGETLNIADVSTDPRYLAGWRDARSELVVPLKLDGEVVGILDMQSSTPGAFTPEDERTLSAFADRAALALRLADVVAQLEERTRVLEAVTRAMQLLNFRLHAPDVLASVVEETSRAFPVSDGGIAYVANPEGTTLTVAAGYGAGRITERAWEGVAIPLHRLRCAGRSFAENRPVLLDVTGLDALSADDPPGVRARARAAFENTDVRSLMAVPIRVADHRLGVLEVLSGRPGAFSARDGETLGLLAEQTAIALRNARLVEELQRSNRLKDDFLANLSHEVRTPLTGIVGWAEVLLDSRGDDPTSRRALEAILGQANTLSRMLADLIDLSRIDNFGLEIRRTKVRLAEIIGAALDAVAPSAAKKGVELFCDILPDLPPLEGDPARLQQVVWNLLSNAIKFSPPEKVVRIVAQGASGGGLELSVSDEGSGIDPAFLPHLFERFRQEDTSSNRRFGGLGVGLSIVKAIVEAHGGSIVAESEGKGHGSLFRITFPPDRVLRSGAFRRSQLLPREGASREEGRGS
jgi:signal transduction histidine kinase